MLFNKTEVTIKKGDITKEDSDAIVNAANTTLMGGGGVDGAIHRAGGPAILEECKAIVAKRGRCFTGDAVITTGGNLQAKYVVHTVGPVWNGGEDGEPDLLKNSYISSLEAAKEEGAKSIAFPAISTGAYRFPKDKACRVALETVIQFVKYDPHFEEVRFILFSDDDFKLYEETMEGMH